jgi:hypothetical protein
LARPLLTNTNLNMKLEKGSAMAARSKYTGLCETCEQDATCTLKRSSQLEIIYCEQFFTQPLMEKKTTGEEEASQSADPQRQDIGSCSAK